MNNINVNRKLPHEGVAQRDDTDELAPTDSDTEGHRAGALPRLPGTGGDAIPRRPSSGGELIAEDDVEGHVR